MTKLLFLTLLLWLQSTQLYIGGAKPVLADVDKETLCISYESIKSLINKNTKAIILVHLYGNTPEIQK